LGVDDCHVLEVQIRRRLDVPGARTLLKPFHDRKEALTSTDSLLSFPHFKGDMFGRFQAQIDLPIGKYSRFSERQWWIGRRMVDR